MRRAAFSLALDPLCCYFRPSDEKIEEEALAVIRMTNTKRNPLEVSKCAEEVQQECQIYISRGEPTVASQGRDCLHAT